MGQNKKKTCVKVKCLSKHIKSYFFQKKSCVPLALLKIFRPVTRNTLIFLFSLFSRRQKPKVLIRPNRCVEWFAPLLFMHNKIKFSRDKARLYLTDQNTDSLCAKLIFYVDLQTNETGAVTLKTYLTQLLLLTTHFFIVSIPIGAVTLKTNLT